AFFKCYQCCYFVGTGSGWLFETYRALQAGTGHHCYLEEWLYRGSSSQSSRYVTERLMNCGIVVEKVQDAIQVLGIDTLEVPIYHLFACKWHLCFAPRPQSYCFSLLVH